MSRKRPAQVNERDDVHLSCTGLLFDLDGTLVDSYADAQECWRAWAEAAGLGATFDLAPFFGQSRTRIIQTLLPRLPAREIEEQAERVRLAERTRVSGVTAMAGAAELLAALPPLRWGIVTSNDAEVTRARLRSAGLPVPAVLISADDVTHPKPDPQGFLLGAKKLGYQPSSLVGVDDSPIGLAAARDAGLTVAAVRFRRDDNELQDADFIVNGLESMQARETLNGITLTISGYSHTNS